jgi:hypothetical protein
MDILMSRISILTFDKMDFDRQMQHPVWGAGERGGGSLSNDLSLEAPRGADQQTALLFTLYAAIRLPFMYY